MGRSPSKTTHVIENDAIYFDNPEKGKVELDTFVWFMWLAAGEETFSFEGVTFRAETRRKNTYWYGYKKCGEKLLKAYAGRTQDMFAARLRAVATALHRETLPAK